MANPYGKTNKELIRDWAEQKLIPGEAYTKSQLLGWFLSQYPKMPSEKSIRSDFRALTVNTPNRHNTGAKPGSWHDLFLQDQSGRLCLFDRENEPSGPYEATETGEASALVKTDDQSGTPAQKSDTNELDLREKDLQNFLVKNLPSIEPGLRLFERDGMPGIEYPAGGGRRIDILALDKHDDFVIVELKVVRGYDRVIGQLQRYMAWVEKHLASGKKVRGIIIAPEITDDLKLATSFIADRVKLLEYSLSFEIREPSLESEGFVE